MKISSIISTIKKNKKGIIYTLFGLILISVYTYDALIQRLNKEEDGWHGKDMARKEFIKNSNWPSKGNLKHKVWLGFEELKKTYLENPTDTIAMKAYADFLFESHKGEYAIPIYEEILGVYPKREDIEVKLLILYYNFNKYDELIDRFYYNDSLLLDMQKISTNKMNIDSLILNVKYIISQRE
tara:strand:+ start:18287 stop:18835 length:549 start_codon:yes stop_codon:yes gene_type:complete